MGRSKFPGKPSKHVNKKRVNVLPYSVTSPLNNHNYKSPEINNSQCDTEQTVTFSGFSTQEADQAARHVEAQQRELNHDNANDDSNTPNQPDDMTAGKHCNGFKVVTNETIDNSIKENHSSLVYKFVKTDNSVKSKTIIHKKSLRTTKRIVKKQEIGITIRLRETQESGSIKNGTCTITRKPTYNVNTRRQNKLCRSKTSTPVNSPVSLRAHDKESTSLVGKFVLPSRSLHSSRVIKPNKRFINSEQIHSLTSSEFLSKNMKKVKGVEKCKGKPSEYNIRQRRKCAGVKKTIIKENEKPPESVEPKSDVQSEPVPTVANITYKSNKESSDIVALESPNSASGSWSCGKLVLRKARLQLHTHSSESPDGPFSSYSSATVNPPGTVTCGVCGAVRFYRFVKQARKFNIYSCESCRKFISKMIKRQACSKTCGIPQLVCHKGQGMCHVPPIVRSQQWKLIRCAYKARCPACWLKMCLRSFQMPSPLKTSLTNLLPENMRYTDHSPTVNTDYQLQKKMTTAPRQLVGWQPLTFELDGRKTRSVLRDKTDKFEKFVSPLKIEILPLKNDLMSNNREKKHRKTRLRVRKKSLVKPALAPVTPVPEPTKRQKIDLKGPRVKHVCRSASIVLGQPIATFSPEISPSVKKKDATPEVVEEQIAECVSCNIEPADQSEKIEKVVAKPDVVKERALSNSIVSKNCALLSRKNLKPTGALESRVQNVLKRSAAVNSETAILTDFWENYDPDEICYTGFGIIASEPFSVNSLCFLCGSSGREQLIHCASCCEPFHPFCLDNSVIDRSIQEGKGTQLNPFPINDPYWRFSWTCARCTTCHSCGMSVRKEKVFCQKCHKSYHPGCLNPRWRNSDRPTICSSCLHCKSCGSENVSKFVCNIPLCAPCFKLRKKGNFCPLCQRCYDDHDFDIKMMECGECKHWVHAKCEGLTDEKYQVLSYLPESVAFVCRICSSNVPAHWQNVMEAELKNNYHNVLRSLSKNRMARELLKWSPMRNHSCSCQPVGFSKKISFYNNEEIVNGTDTVKRNYGKNIDNLREVLQCDIEDESSQDSKSEDASESTETGDDALKNMKKKYCLKECSVRIKNCSETKEKYSQFKNTASFSSVTEYNEEKEISREEQYPLHKNEVFHCNKHDHLPITSLLDIKKKINSSFYKTLKEFQRDVEDSLKKASCEQLLTVLQSIMKEVFPWYDPSSLSISLTGDLCKSNVDVLVEEEKIKSINTNLLDSELPSLKLKGIPEEALSNYVYGDEWCTSDTRICVLCKGIGDGIPSLEGRLLYCGHNDWIHANCALWSAEVFEEIDGSLQNVQSAMSRGKMIRCGVCKQKGASIGCCAKGCSETYHYTCARTLNCYFMHDKTVYCPSHYDAASTKTLVNDNEFEIRRPVYVELDGKKKKYIEPSKARYVIGSLTVTRLGKLFHPLSDTEEALIPSEFMCNRLFWSTIEPWKIVRYTVSTSILVPKVKNLLSLEKHFTVDHSMSSDCVEKSLEEISRWRKMLESGHMEVDDTEKSACTMNQHDNNKVISQIIENMLDVVCTKEVEENCDDEPQNTADLLPPELKDAIFEDLPHDLLDGISMQDIFPKLMSYEDVITMDLRNSEMNETNDYMKDPKTDLSNDIISSVDGDEFSLQSQYRGKRDLFLNESDMWLEPKCAIQGLDDYVQSKISANIAGPELKRSKSEVFPGIKKLTRNRNHQRSCSLTWSCKLDNTLTNNIKKRKVSCGKNASDYTNNLFMVVDGTGEKGGMLQELRLPEGVLMTVGRGTNADCMTDTMRELKYRLEENTALPNDRYRLLNQQLEPGKENKCRIWQSRPQSRILQVDGADDYSSSESDSPSHEADTGIVKSTKYVPVLEADISDEPVKCDRCQCTYRTHDSYKRHLSTCDFITSESDSDVPMDNDKIDNKSEFVPIEFNTESSATLNGAVLGEVQLVEPEVQTLANAPTQQSMMVQENHMVTTVQTQQTLLESKQPQIVYESIPCTVAPVLAPTITPTTLQIENLQQSLTPGSILQSITLPQHQVNHVVNNPQQTMSMNSSPHMSTTIQNIDLSDINGQNVTIAMVPPPPKPPNNKYKPNTARTATNSRGRGRPARQIATKRLRSDKPVHIVSQNSNYQSNTIRFSQNNPTVIIQHLPSPNLMPAYVEAFQQQTGQNLQCIATIMPTEYKPSATPSFLTPNSLVPGTFQIQSADSNVINLPNSGLSMVPGLQIAQAQPTMMGTIIQQPRPATIQCGMMTTEQLLLGTPVSTMPTMPTVDTIVTDQSGSMYLTSQPVYYGFETIVQNTVMQSQQFMSTTLPGVLASNSSYSATTTQVFQASKIEPVVEINGAGYIIVNPTMPQVATPISVSHATQPVIAPLQSRPATLIAPQPSMPEPQATYPVQISSIQEPSMPSIEPLKYNERPIEPNIPIIKPQLVTTPIEIKPAPPPVTVSIAKPVPVTSSSIMTTSSITLPVAPYATENGIPMNIVNPIPQVVTSVAAPQTSRPMNRVLPMQTVPQRDFHKPRSPVNKVISLEPPEILNKLSETVDKIKETLNSDSDSMQSVKMNTNDNLLKLESASLKLVFQKQSQDGIYKISNKYVSKNNIPVQGLPTKPAKSKTVETVINVRSNVPFVRKEKEAKKEKPVKPAPKVTSENNPNILYKMQSEDGFDYQSTSLTDLWSKVFEAVQQARAVHNMPPLPQDALNMMNGLQLMGLKSNGLRYLVEQMPGAEKITKYKPEFHKTPKVKHRNLNLEDGHSQGSIRCVEHIQRKEPYDMFSWLASRHRRPDCILHVDYENTSRRSTSVNLPMAMRFRQLKETSRQAVGVYRSNIHGRGLFCLRDIESGEMVIEYAGEVIRSTLTDKREKTYNSKGIGCYMFRVDDNLVVDATMKGNAARFINHSCDPNCYSRVLDILGHKHILIFALRKIMQGEELTYDYKFPFEEDKIPCTCGSRRCRKYLN